MSRRVEPVLMGDDAGRDKGRSYRITEMHPVQAEEWAARAFLALAQSGASIPKDMMSSGMQGIAIVGITGLRGLPWGLAKPLMDELMACVEFVPDPKKPEFVLKDIDNHIEEVKTRLELKARAFVLHTGFSWADVLSNAEKASAAAEKKAQSSGASTQTSPSP